MKLQKVVRTTIDNIIYADGTVESRIVSAMDVTDLVQNSSAKNLEVDVVVQDAEAEDTKTENINRKNWVEDELTVTDSWGKYSLLKYNKRSQLAYALAEHKTVIVKFKDTVLTCSNSEDYGRITGIGRLYKLHEDVFKVGSKILCRYHQDREYLELIQV